MRITFQGVVAVLLAVLALLLFRVYSDKPFFLLPTNVTHEKPPLGANSIVITPITLEHPKNTKGKARARSMSDTSWKVTQIGGSVEDRSLSPADEIAVYSLFLVAFSGLTGLCLLLIGFQSFKESQNQGNAQASLLKIQSDAMKALATSVNIQADSLEKQIAAREKHHADEFAPVLNILPGVIKISPGDEDQQYQVNGIVDLRVVNGGRGASINTKILLHLGEFICNGFIDVGTINSNDDWKEKTIPVTWISPEGGEPSARSFLKLHNALVPEATELRECLSTRNMNNISAEEVCKLRSLRITVTYDNILNAYMFSEPTPMYEASVSFSFDHELWSPVVLKKNTNRISKELA